MNKYGQINLYACGGAGINIAKHFEKFRKDSTEDHEDDKTFARINPIYIDTSKSNTSNSSVGFPKEFTYTFRDVDGSGKVRSENSDVIIEHVLPILQQFKPTGISIVVSSTSGGTGSVLAPSLVSELLGRGETVIVCAISSEDSLIEVTNTSNTLKSYDNIARTRKKPVVMIYRNNNENPGGRSAVDAEIVQEITKISALYSRNNRELDSKDLHNWLFYNTVTSFQPKLCLLDFYQGKIDDLKNGQVVSVATLCLDGVSSSTGMIVEYQAVGYVSEEQNQKTKLSSALHYVILDGVIPEIHKEITAKLKQIDESQRARISRHSIISENDRATSNGLIL